MDEQRFELTTHKTAVMASAAWPMLLAWTVMTVFTLLTSPFSEGWPLIALMAAVMVITFFACMGMYLGTYLFLPADAMKGPRIIARVGRTETVIAGVTAGDIVVKQGWMEKRFGVCHIRLKGSAIYLRGVKEPERVKAWVTANFPAERKPSAKRKKK